MSTPAPPPSEPRAAFVFVCQAGELEVKALLLAASLRREFGADIELIAAVPTPAGVWGEPCDITRAQLDRLGVRRVPITNPIDDAYPIGNKLACLDVPARAARLVFLDSDILCLRDPGDGVWLRCDFAAKPADLRTFAAAPEAWQPLYAAAGVAVPPLRLPTTVSGEFGPPYFNSGVIVAARERGLGAAWIACARAIDAQLSRHEQRHWLDQVSLPIAVQRLGLRYAALDERFNHPAHLKPLASSAPVFCHYHWPRIVAREPLLHARVHELIAEHPPIGHVAARHPDWAALLQRPARAAAGVKARAPAPAPRDCVIAAMPGVDAAALAQLLQARGVRVAAATAECASAIAEAALPWEIAALLQELRAAPQDGADRGAAIRCDGIAALCRLPALQRVAAPARLIVCVADPFSAIAAWKRGAADAFDAELAHALGVAVRHLPPRAADELRRIVTLADRGEKHAAAWWWLAQRVLDARGATIVHAQELRAPEALLARLAGGEAAAAAHPIDADAGAGILDDGDRQAIAAICLQAAAELGLEF